MSGYHARLGFSRAERTVNCPGSVQLCEQWARNDETPEQAEGTAAHWVLEQAAKGELVPEGTFAPNGVEVTAEMLECAEDLLADVDAEARRLPDDYKLVIEQYLPCTHLHPDNGGTPDVYLYSLSRGVLIVWEYKFGRRFVDEKDNFQLANQAIAILHSLNISAPNDEHVQVTMKVYQPRYYRAPAMREWRAMASDLRAHGNRLKLAYEEATGPNPPCRSGPWCVDCDGRLNCETFQQSVNTLLSFQGVAQSSEASDLALGLELALIEDALTMLKGAQTALEQEILSRQQAGRIVPGWARMQAWGNLKFKDPQEAISLGDLWGIDLRKPGATLTPTQAIKAGIDESVILSYAERRNNGFKLTRTDETQLIKLLGDVKSD